MLASAEQTPAGLSWKMSPDYPRDMPNFSHGTAGVAYFLCQLSQATGEKKFLDAAIAGAKHLEAIGKRDDGTFCVHHNSPDGEELFYLGWCHGPPGTARLFYALAQATGDDHWHELVHAAAKTIMQSGIPGTRTDGFWKNYGICCGNAGVAEFFLELSLAYDRPDYRAFAETVTQDLLQAAKRKGDQDVLQLSWVHAEHRVQPDNTAAQTGYMQGSAGIGILLLRMHAASSGGPQPVRLPDSPFAKRD
jgi:lantibiotic modifying enzyme